MKIIILVLIFTIGILLYLLFSNLFALYMKKHPPKEDTMDFYNTYERKYTQTKEIPTEPNQPSPPNAFPECFMILGFNSLPTEIELKTKYRELAKQNHPDKGGDPAKFEEISKAYNEALKIIKTI